MERRGIFHALALVLHHLQLCGLLAGGGLRPGHPPPQAGPQVPDFPPPVPGVRPGGVPYPCGFAPGEKPPVGGAGRGAGRHRGRAGHGRVLPLRPGGGVLGLRRAAGEPGRAGVPGVLLVLDRAVPDPGVRGPSSRRRPGRPHPPLAGAARPHPAGLGRAGVLRRPAPDGLHRRAALVRALKAIPMASAPSFTAKIAAGCVEKS